MRCCSMTSRVSFVLDTPSNVVGWRSSMFFPTLPRSTTIRTVSCRPIASRHHWTAFSSGPVAAASNNPAENLGNGQTEEDGSDANAEKNAHSVFDTIRGWWRRIQNPELRQKLVSLGPAAVLAYGLFDGFTYTIAFTIAFLAYEANTGLNPTQNVADLVKICILMWGGNNVTRPFRLAGAAALAPFMDRLMDKLQERLKLPNKAFAFGLIVSLVAAICFSIIGALFVSRWVRG